MKIRKNKEEVMRISYNAMAVGEVYKDGSDTYYMRTPDGITNLSSGNHMHARDINNTSIFIHLPDAEMVV